MELVDDGVKNAIVSKLISMQPDVVAYKEAVTSPIFPHFFVYQVDVESEKDRRDVIILNYIYNVRYRVASDPSTILKLQNKLDSMSIKFLTEFDIIEMGEDKIRCENKTCEKVDGVLHFNFTVKILYRKQKEDAVKQGRLDIKVEA